MRKGKRVEDRQEFRYASLESIKRQRHSQNGEGWLKRTTNYKGAECIAWLENTLGKATPCSADYRAHRRGCESQAHELQWLNCECSHSVLKHNAAVNEAAMYNA